MRRSELLLLVCLLVIILAVLGVNNPIRNKVPHFDSADRLYHGWRIIEGDTPYVEVRSQKPPVIYYINAVGVLLGGNTRWGIWVIEVIALCGAATISYLTLKRLFGCLPAFFGTAAWLMSLVFVLEGGNFTEEFVLPLQLATLYFFVRAEERQHYGWYSVWIGALSVLAFGLRQNLVAVWLAVGLVVLVSRLMKRRWKDAFTTLWPMFAAALALVLLAIAYFAALGALDALWEAAFTANFRYSDSSLNWRLGSIFIGLGWLTGSGLTLVGLAGWAIGALVLFFSDIRLSPVVRSFLTVLIVALPLEIALSAISGYAHAHYYISWLPVLGLLAGSLVAGLQKQITMKARLTVLGRWYPVQLATVVPVLLLVVMSILPLKQLEEQYEGLGEQQHLEVVQYISDHTTSDETVLVWGFASEYNFLSARPSPTRFVNQQPLFDAHFQLDERRQLVAEFAQQIHDSPPALIVDTAGGNALLPTLREVLESENWEADRGSGKQIMIPEIKVVIEDILTRYEKTDVVGSGWQVYRYVGDAR